MIRRLMLGLLCALAPAALLAGVGVWTTNGPPGGSYTVITASGSPGIVYAGGERLFRSADNGSTWTATGLTDQGASPLATSPPATVYVSTFAPVATTSLQVSHDDGMHWAVIGGGEFTVFGLAVDPVVSATLFESAVTTVEHTAFALSSMLRSVDGGATWIEIDSGLGLSTSMISTIAADPSISGTLYVATRAQIAFPAATHGLYKTTDAGATWSLLPATSSIFSIQTIAIDRQNSSVIYAGSPFSNVGVIKSVDGGNTFGPMNSGLTSLNVGSLCIDPVRPNRLYAATGAGVFASVDGAMSWQPMNTGLTDLNVYSLAIDTTGQYLHAATSSGVFDYQIPVSTCVQDSHTLCLNNGRFAVTADFQSTPEGPSAPATAVPLTSDTGYFWFFDPANIELVVKVLTGCSVNSDYWFFASGLTNVGVQINVTDTVTGATKPYSSIFGTPFPPIQDTAAFSCP